MKLSLLWRMLLLATALGTGCVADGLTDESTATQDLIGASPTRTRPEIGRVFGSGCTATLISDRMVLTAAHCLSPAYVGSPTAPPGSFFQLNDATGAIWNYAIDKTLSFHPQGDVAIMHLTSAVPASRAVPAVIASAPPALYTTSTTYGFGCNSTTGSGYGIKRAFMFPYGQQTSVLCPGDSGGPVTSGDTGGSGSIWGVNVSHSPDRFAMVTYLLPQIEAAKRLWDGNSDVSYDRPGLDFAHTSAGSAEGCNESCDNNPRCKAWSFVPSTNSCFWKSGVPEPIAVAGVTSGLARGREIGFDRPGSDYGINSYGSGGSAARCAQDCTRDRPCKAWTYVPTTHQCWLKNAVPQRVSNPGCVSGTPERTYETGYDRPGGDLRQVHADNAGNCAWSCATDASCKAFVWSATRTSNGTSNCWLKSVVTPAVEAAEFTAGARSGMIVGSFYTGTPFRSFQITSPIWPQVGTASPSSAAAVTCQVACATEYSCKGWNVLLDPDHGATCDLLQDPGTPSLHNRMIGGLKGLEHTP